MSILIDSNTLFMVQGITGREGSFYTQGCIDYGTNILAGVSPGSGGLLWRDKLPIFDTVKQAVEETKANASLIFVPALSAPDAILEAVEASISPIIVITEFIPTLDMVKVRSHLKEKGIHLIGPNCPGIISPGKCKAGIMAAEAFCPGNVGVIARSGTLTYEISAMLTEQGIGQSTCVGIGGDPVLGMTMSEVLALFEQDSETKAVVLIGEIGGTFEQEAAKFIEEKMAKPVIAFIAGSVAPSNRRMGHAGAIITGSAGTAEEKKKALASVGVLIAETLPDVPSKTRWALKNGFLGKCLEKDGKSFSLPSTVWRYRK